MIDQKMFDAVTLLKERMVDPTLPEHVRMEIERAGSYLAFIQIILYCDMDFWLKGNFTPEVRNEFITNIMDLSEKYLNSGTIFFYDFNKPVIGGEQEWIRTIFKTDIKEAIKSVDTDGLIRSIVYNRTKESDTAAYIILTIKPEYQPDISLADNNKKREKIGELQFKAQGKLKEMGYSPQHIKIITPYTSV